MIGWAARLALRNLARNRRRNLATGLAVALGYAGLVLLGGYVLRIEHYLRTANVYLKHSGHVSVYKEDGVANHMVKPAAYSLDPAEQSAIAAALAGDARVERVGRYLRGTGLAGNGCKTVPFVALGVEPEIDRWVRDHPEVQAATPELAQPLAGRALSTEPRVDGASMLAGGLARLLGKPRVHDDIPADQPLVLVADCTAADAAGQIAADANVQLAAGTYAGSFSAVDAEVVGHFSTGRAETEDSALITELATLQRLYDTDRVTYMAVYLHDAGDLDGYAADLEQRLRAGGLGVQVVPFDDERISLHYVGVIGFLEVMAGFICVVVFAVVVLSLLNTMTLAILERTREIGTLRSLGFTRRNVISLFVREGLALCVLALIAGLGLALVVARAVNAADIRYTPPGSPRPMQFLLQPSPLLCAVLALVMLLLALLATFVATRRRARTRVADLLTTVST